jgi:hypothetical protein
MSISAMPPWFASRNYKKLGLLKNCQKDEAFQRQKVGCQTWQRSYSSIALFSIFSQLRCNLERWLFLSWL